jgi:hypothetical protein
VQDNIVKENLKNYSISHIHTQSITLSFPRNAHINLDTNKPYILLTCPRPCPSSHAHRALTLNPYLQSRPRRRPLKRSLPPHTLTRSRPHAHTLTPTPTLKPTLTPTRSRPRSRPHAHAHAHAHTLTPTLTPTRSRPRSRPHAHAHAHAPTMRSQ